MNPKSGWSNQIDGLRINMEASKWMNRKHPPTLRYFAVEVVVGIVSVVLAACSSPYQLSKAIANVITSESMRLRGNEKKGVQLSTAALHRHHHLRLSFSSFYRLYHEKYATFSVHL